jgi:uncharacterized Zn-binding protein involved in type VI secretion
MASISVAGDTNVHGGAPFDSGLSTNVLAGGKGIALASQTTSTSNDDLYNQNRRSHPQGIAGNQLAVGGSGTVFINGKPIHRVGDARVDGATAGPGLGSCQVG